LCHATVTATAPNPQQSFLTAHNFDGLFVSFQSLWLS